MKTQVIVKTHELALKGKNQPWFMRRLAENLRHATRGTGVERVWQARLMIGLTLTDEDCWPEVRERVKDCFGVAKFYKAYDLPQDLELLKQTAAKSYWRGGRSIPSASPQTGPTNGFTRRLRQ